MQNKKIVWIGVGAGILLLLMVVGLWLAFGRDKGQVSYGASAGRYSKPVAPNAYGGLGVANSPSASNLGQLNVGQNGSGGSQGSIGSGLSGGSSPQASDPSTFSQYEKYKDNPNALFGDIQVGNGAELTANKKAAVYYKGWLTNGQVFDQSRAGSDGKLQPFVFTLGAGQVIRGWEEGLYGMKAGGSRLVIVPPAVGYGAEGQGNVPGNSMMVFEVQLVAVE